MRIQHDIAAFLRGQPRYLLVSAALGFMVALEIVNYFAGHEFRLIVFYLVPLYLLTWFVNIRWALLFAAILSLSWYLVGRLIIGMELPSHAWNAVTRLAIFIAFIYMINAYKRESVFAREDFLTKIANSQHFAETAAMELERCRRYGHPFSVVYLDIDNFKDVNDRFGHSAGNRLLYEVAQDMRRNTRSIDTVARLGGDEFAVLFPETGYEQARAAVSILRDKMLSLARERSWPVTFSFGLVTFQKAPGDFDEMVRQADMLMYQAKREGKDQIRSSIYR